MLAVYGVVEPAHVVLGDFSGQFVECLLHFGMPSQDLLTNNRNRLVGREVVAVIFEDKEIQSWNEAVGGVAGGKIDLFVFEAASQQAQDP